MDTRRFRRTAKGQEEIAGARKTLKGKLRTALFLVEDGKAVDEILERFQAIGAPIDALSQLAAEGYIEPLGAAPVVGATPPPVTSSAPPANAGMPASVEAFRTAKALMNDTVVDALGIRAFGFTLKLERCATTQDLTPLLPTYAEALGRKMPPQAVRALVTRVQDLIAAPAR